MGVDINASFLGCIFRNWRWSWRKPTIQQLKKFTPDNITYYARWITLIPLIPLERIKFCDESHFVSQQLHRSQVIGPINTSSYLSDAEDISDSFSLTLLVNLANPANLFYIDLRANSNTEWDFLDFVCDAILSGHLQRGDFFVVDNASIHFGGETRPYLTRILNHHGVRYLFLPTYSPELNPCELVFNVVKQYIRNHRVLFDQIPQLLLCALASIPHSHLVKFYDKCVNVCSRIV